MLESVTEPLNEECRFLHDLAGPLAAAIFTLEALEEDLGADHPSLARVRLALDQMREQLEQRRKLLISGDS